MSRNLSIDLSFLSISLSELSEEFDYHEFKQVLEYLTRAKYHDRLKEYLLQVEKMYNEGADLASAFDHSYFDLFLNPEKNI